MDPRDEEAADLLLQLGLPRGVARALVYLSRVDEATSPQIEVGAKLRQPEVSVAMQELRDRAWVLKREQRREGKGRPVHCYRLAIRLPEVVDLLEREKHAEAERHDRAIERLRALSNGKAP